jgi:polyisoprenoid-binding protein YceI
VLALAVVGCHLCSPRDVKPTRPPTTSTAAPAPAAPVQAGTFSISPANSSITFTGSTTITSHTGHFEAFEGTLEAPTNDPKDVKIRVAVQMDSTTTKIGLLTKHLKNEDFFDVAHYPMSEFVLVSISPAGEAGRYQVSGTLTLHGVQKLVSFPARIAITPEEVSFEATMTVRQSEFGMIEGAKKTKDDVPVSVSIRGRRR